MKILMHHHAIVSNHLILETKHLTCHNSTTYMLEKENLLYQIWLFWYTLIIPATHIDLTVFSQGLLLNCLYHGSLYKNLHNLTATLCHITVICAYINNCIYCQWLH